MYNNIISSFLCYTLLTILFYRFINYNLNLFILNEFCLWHLSIIEFRY